MNAVIEHVPNAATAVEIKAHVHLIQEVMQAVMKDNTHYGVIPGTQKPTLYKAGSEVLLSTFRIAVEPEVEDLSTHDEVRYRVRAVGRHQTTGVVIGVGLGECSSNEEKYRWRKAVCDAEFNDTPETRRRVKYAHGRGGSVYTINQIRTVPADVANTVLKMAKKRAQIDLTLTALAASDIFTQDIEDAPDELRDNIVDREDRAREEPRARTGNGKATAAQVGLLTKKLEAAQIPMADLLAHFEIHDLTELPFNAVNEALDWIKEHAKG